MLTTAHGRAVSTSLRCITDGPSCQTMTCAMFWGEAIPKSVPTLCPQLIEDRMSHKSTTQPVH